MIYQTPADLRRQDEVARACAEAWACEVERLGELGCIDVAFRRAGALSAYAEIKCRTNAHDRYPDYLIDAAKVERGRWIAGYDGVPYLVIVRFTDGIWYARIRESDPLRIAAGGRVDRGDPMDIDRCAFIPMGAFRKLKGPNGPNA